GQPTRRLARAMKRRERTNRSPEASTLVPQRPGEQGLRVPNRVPNCGPARFPVWELDNIIMTPHVAGQSESTVRGRWAFLASQLQRLAEGRPLENVVAVGT